MSAYAESAAPGNDQTAYHDTMNSLIQQAELNAVDGAASNYFGIAVSLNSDGDTAIAGAYGVDVGGNSNQGAAYVFAVPPSPTGVTASYDFYIDRVRVTWNAANSASSYDVLRATSDDLAQATSIGTGIIVTNYDDTNTTAATPYYYWVKTINANGTSACSASATGQMLFGPDVRINNEAGPVTLNVGCELVVTVSINPGQYAGAPMDWWVAVIAPSGLYFMNASMAWTTTASPAHQGDLFGLQSYQVLDITTLPAGTYTFYFGVDTLNGVLDPDVVYDSATVTIEP